MEHLIIANWKSNPRTLKEAIRIFNFTKKVAAKGKKRKIIVCPPFVYIPFLKGLSLGGQNCFYNEGPYTGEVSPSMLKEFNCKYVILGHSERRKYFNEDSKVINKKIKAVLKKNMIPVLCVGETLNEKKDGKTKTVIKKQITSSLEGVDAKKIIVAYEPVWSIGSLNPCNPKTASEVRLLIFKLTKTKIIYGGSINGENAKEYLNVGFDGLLVGGASLIQEEIEKIARQQ